MPKITDVELEKVLLRLFKSDLAYFKLMYGNSFGVNKAIRTVLHTFVVQSQARADVAINDAEQEGLLTTQEDTDVLLGS